MNVEHRVRTLIVGGGIAAAAAGGAILHTGLQDAPFRTHPLVTHMKELNRKSSDFSLPEQERETAENEVRRLHSIEPVNEIYLKGTETKINIYVGALVIVLGLAAVAGNKQLYQA